MGAIIRWVPPTQAAMANALATVSDETAKLRTNVIQTRKLLRSAVKHGDSVMAALGEAHGRLEWTAQFCDQCSEAMRLNDLDEMIRQRDDLATQLDKVEATARASIRRAVENA